MGSERAMSQDGRYQRQAARPAQAIAGQYPPSKTPVIRPDVLPSTLSNPVKPVPLQRQEEPAVYGNGPQGRLGMGEAEIYSQTDRRRVGETQQHPSRAVPYANGDHRDTTVTVIQPTAYPRDAAAAKSTDMPSRPTAAAIVTAPTSARHVAQLQHHTHHSHHHHASMPGAWSHPTGGPLRTPHPLPRPPAPAAAPKLRLGREITRNLIVLEAVGEEARNSIKEFEAREDRERAEAMARLGSTAAVTGYGNLGLSVVPEGVLHGGMMGPRLSYGRAVEGHGRSGMGRGSGYQGNYY
ncbi:hypothetical protein HK101_005651 [Irineochytrium annulatum]|nr:hypothetical protein HK101_005651 [Irineochytrium annulatum]